MKDYLKTLFRLLARNAGLEIKLFHPVNSQDLQRKLIFDHLQIGNVIDVGANNGQYALSLRRIGYRGTIISFEPLKQAHSQLIKRSASDDRWLIAERCALGSEKGHASLNISGNSVSSSILSMTDTHVEAAPESRTMATEDVVVKTLDTAISTQLDKTHPTFLKIDTQGYEWEVLRGSTRLLKTIVGLEVELSLVQLYNTQKLFREMNELILASGFELWGVWPEFAAPDTGRTLQINGIYVKVAHGK